MLCNVDISVWSCTRSPPHPHTPDSLSSGGGYDLLNTEPGVSPEHWEQLGVTPPIQLPQHTLKNIVAIKKTRVLLKKIIHKSFQKKIQNTSLDCRIIVSLHCYRQIFCVVFLNYTCTSDFLRKKPWKISLNSWILFLLKSKFIYVNIKRIIVLYLLDIDMIFRFSLSSFYIFYCLHYFHFITSFIHFAFFICINKGISTSLNLRYLKLKQRTGNNT